MKTCCRIIVLALVSAFLVSCAPVLRRDLMDAGARNVPLSEIMRNKALNEGRLFILGGSIVNTKVTKDGSMIEALYVYVDSRGFPDEMNPSEGRFLALFPKESGILDPAIYSQGKEMTLAAVFAGTVEGKIGEMDYTYPLFRIKQIYLWSYYSEPYYYPYPYYSPYSYPYYYDPFYFDRPFFRHRYYRGW